MMARLDPNMKTILLTIESQATGSCINDVMPQLDKAIGEDGYIMRVEEIFFSF